MSKLERGKVIVLGHKGMLGRMVMKYFTSKNYHLHTLKHRFDKENKWCFIDEIRKFPDAVVINCIGKIKQKTQNLDDLLWANAILPLELNNHLLPNQTLVHPSTDCVFDGNIRSAYHIIMESNARDDYGWSKRLGEIALMNRKNTIIFRVSIIGPEIIATPKGLLGWFLSQPQQSKLKGFTNHFWNGITTLEWCKQVERYLLTTPGFSKESKILQIGTKESLSKYELLNLFQKIFDTKHSIEAFETEKRINRKLAPQIICPPIEQQLQELKTFMNKEF